MCNSTFLLRTSLLLFLWVLFHLAPWVSLPAKAAERKLLFREDFATLDNWRPLPVSKGKPFTLYSIGSEGNDHFLKAESHGSASALVWKNEFDIHQYHKARWTWKVSNTYKKGDTGDKSGDDYPIRIYILFKYEPERATALDRIYYGLAKAAYGEYPPHSTLTYVWANKEDVKPMFKSPYTDRVMLIPLEKGEAYLGKWREEEVDFVRDYRRAFGVNPPNIASLAIMNDSDNTGEQSISYVTHIEVFDDGKDDP
jgi:hypothetical protein